MRPLARSNHALRLKRARAADIGELLGQVFLEAIGHVNSFRLPISDWADYNSDMVKLNDEQIRIAEEGTPVEVRDGEHVLYLISKHQFDRIKPLLDAEDIDPSFFEFDEDNDS
jgi:hypothetical protein